VIAAAGTLGAMQMCTIVSRSNIASARVLARSFRRFHPDGVCRTLVIDDPGHELDVGAQPFEVVWPEQLAIGPWDRMTAGYDPRELCQATTPWLLRHLLGRSGGGRVVYLDASTQVFDSLAEVDELLCEHAVVVNAIGCRPWRATLAAFAAGDEVDEMLERWIDRLTTECLVAPQRGYLVDQRWVDSAATLHVLVDLGYNLSPAGLADCSLERVGSVYSIEGKPVRLVDFRGVDAANLNLPAGTVARQLRDSYLGALSDERYYDWQQPYGWGALPDGTPLDTAARRAYREAVTVGELPDERLFNPSGADAFLAYLRGRGRHGGLTRYLESVHAGRRDLQEEFPDLNGVDGARLVAWAHTFGRTAGEVVPALLGTPAEQSSPVTAVNVAGYFAGVMGVGEHARQLAGALRIQAIPVTTTMLHPEAAPEDDALAKRPDTGPGPDPEATFNLLCANADSVPGVAQRLGDQFFADRYTIGFWAWEVSAFPERFRQAFGYLDEVWVGSRHVRDAVVEAATVPVLTIPQPVSLAQGARDAQPPSNLPDGFRFLFAFDYLSVLERKNPLAVIAAFSGAFEPGSGASLILKSLNEGHNRPARDRLRAAAAAHPDIHLIERRLPQGERDGLMRAADCYVSLHRAEGFGYTLAEAMWLGKPVIATGYSGNLDFMTPSNSHLVSNRLVPIGSGHDPYPAAGVWAQPDVDHASALMRDVFEHSEDSRRRGARAAQDIRASHGPEVAGRAIRERLELVMSAPGWRSRGRRRHAEGSRTDAAGDRIREGPVPPPRQRFGAPQRAARKGLLRLLKPVTVHQRLVDDELVRAIEAVDASVNSLMVSQAIALRRIEHLQAELRRLQEGVQRRGRS
jgi:glycosyltransferase involved in cell wall biosynthesis